MNSSNSLLYTAAAMLLDWNEAAHLGPMVAGGKGAQLAQLALYGLPVGEGCVISVQAYHEMMSVDLRAAALRACSYEIDAQEAVLASVREAILKQPLPMPVNAALDKQINNKHWNAIPLAVRVRAIQLPLHCLQVANPVSLHSKAMT